jgi:ribosomal protein L16
MTKTLAKEWGRYHVTVNAVAFGYIQTRLTKPLAEGDAGKIEVLGREVKIGVQAGRIAASQYLRNEGRLYVRVFPHKSITSIPLETRMGKGKGEPEFWAAVIKPGTVLYEIGGVSEEAARVCLARLAHKMPVRVRFVKRRVM